MPRIDGDLRRKCEWCLETMPRAARRDALTCSKSCRQAKARFRVSLAPSSSETRHNSRESRHFTYSDPPYLGCAHYYPENQEVDHAQLVENLMKYSRDGWALSASSDSLAEVLALCPAEARVGIWIKGPRKSITHSPIKTWEPVIFYGGRKRHLDNPSISDSLIFGGRQSSHPNAMIGMKPAKFSEWMFQLLGAEQGDTLHDMFPGSGAVKRAWNLHMGRGLNDDGTDATPSLMPPAPSVAKVASVAKFEAERSHCYRCEESLLIRKRRCGWCEGKMDNMLRVDAKFCSGKCKQRSYDSSRRRKKTEKDGQDG